MALERSLMRFFADRHAPTATARLRRNDAINGVSAA